MKSIRSSGIILMLLIGNLVNSPAQSRLRNLDLRPLLFKNFLNADIVKKDGTTIQASVNYNTDNQSILFLTKNEYMELTGLEEIIQIKIGNDIFIPIEGKVYQETDRSDLFVSYSNKVVVKDFVTSKSGSELKNARENSNSVSNVYVSKNYSSPNDLGFVKKFWILNEKQLVEVGNVKALSKTFNISRNAIKEFVKEHNLNLNNYSDIITLLNYVVKKGV